MARNDGGPAFPARPQERLAGGDIVAGNEGMTLRDWFAGQALPQAILDYDRQTRGVMDTKHPVLPWATERLRREDIIAGQAYRYADAMLKAREAE